MANNDAMGEPPVLSANNVVTSGAHAGMYYVPGHWYPYQPVGLPNPPLPNPYPTSLSMPDPTFLLKAEIEQLKKRLNSLEEANILQRIARLDQTYGKLEDENRVLRNEIRKLTDGTGK